MTNSETSSKLAGAIATAETIAAASRAGGIRPDEAEHLVGFVVGQALGLEPPSRTTWFRRNRQLRALGIEPMATPMVAAGERAWASSDRRSDRRVGERRGGDRRQAAR